MLKVRCEKFNAMFKKETKEIYDSQLVIEIPNITEKVLLSLLEVEFFLIVV